MNPVSKPNRSALIAALALFAAMVAARLAYIDAFALPVPFYDQWDAEGARLLKPFLDGTLPLSELLSAHNEHRILWSRLLSLVVFWFTGGAWDNVALANASSVVLGACGALIAAVAWRSEGSLAQKLTATLLAAAMAALPFAWENMLVGFQSQFYFVMFWGVAGIIATVARPTFAMRLVGLACAFAAVFSMASGVLCIAAMLGVLLLRAISRREIDTATAAYAFALAGLALWGYRIVPVIEPHQVMRPDSLGSLLSALGVALGWPWTGEAARWGWLLWTPAVIFGVRMLAGRKAVGADGVMMGLALLAAGQSLAIASSRGQGMTEVSSRYSELLMLGLIANGWLVFSLVRSLSGHRIAHAWARVALVAWLVLAATPFALRQRADLEAMQLRHGQSCLQQRNLGLFLASGNPALLVQPHLQIPYPNAERLALLASDPTLRPTLSRVADEPFYRTCGETAAAQLAFPVANDTGMPIPLLLGQTMEMHRPAPGVGLEIVELHLLIGTYGGQADGMLEIRACSAGRCTQGTVALVGAADNQPITVRLAEPLPTPEALTLTLRQIDATSPVAVWTYPASAGSITLAGGEGAGRAPKLSLSFRATGPDSALQSP